MSVLLQTIVVTTGPCTCHYNHWNKCLCNVIIARVKIEGIFQIDCEFQEPEKKGAFLASSAQSLRICGYYGIVIGIGYITVQYLYFKGIGKSLLYLLVRVLLAVIKL